MLAIRPAYARLTAVYPGIRVHTTAPPPEVGTVSTGPPPPDGGTAGAPEPPAPPEGGTWVAAADLAAGGDALTAFIAAAAGEAAGTAHRPDVTATLALHRYLWPACLLFTLPWFLHGRVPRLPVDRVWVRPGCGHYAVAAREFACLAGDRAALRLPGARPVATVRALRQELRGALSEHLTPVLAAFAPHVRRGPAALRRLAADETAESLWYVARLLGEEPRAVAELTALLRADARFRTGPDTSRTGAPASGPGPEPGPNTETGSGPGPETGPGPGPGGPLSRARLTCCLYYTLSPSHTCSGCPRGGARRPDTLPGGCELDDHATISLN